MSGAISRNQTFCHSELRSESLTALIFIIPLVEMTNSSQNVGFGKSLRSFPKQKNSMFKFFELYTLQAFGVDNAPRFGHVKSEERYRLQQLCQKNLNIEYKEIEKK